MDLEQYGQPSNQPKQRRRRRAGAPRRRNRAPISARLVVDHHLRGAVGVLSDDLVADLFPDQALAGKFLDDRLLCLRALDICC